MEGCRTISRIQRICGMGRAIGFLCSLCCDEEFGCFLPLHHRGTGGWSMLDM